jgi:phosphatidylserine synthase
MKKSGRKEKVKWSWPVWAVIILGFVIFALPVSEKIKLWLMIPLYVLFAFVYYKYVHKKRSS